MILYLPISYMKTLESDKTSYLVCVVYVASFGKLSQISL